MIAIDEAIENKLWNNFGGLQRLQRDSIQNHCLTLLRYNLPTERCENNWEQAKTSTEVEMCRSLNDRLFLNKTLLESNESLSTI